ARPLGEPLLDAALDEPKSLAELTGDTSLPLGHLASTRVGELPFLLGNSRRRVGTRSRESALELLRPPRRLALDQLVQLRLRFFQLGVDPPAAGEARAERDRQQRRGKADRQSARGNGCASVYVERENDPPGDRSEAE